MKNKTINSKIDALSNRIKSIKSKAENAKNLKESGIFQTLESDLEATIILHKDVETLKDTLKTKTKELKEGVTNIKKSSKNARKMLKKEEKPVKPSKGKKIKKDKSSDKSEVTGSKKKMVKSGEKPVKNKK
jgi:hypothetical protein